MSAATYGTLSMSIRTQKRSHAESRVANSELSTPHETAPKLLSPEFLKFAKVQF